MKTTFVSCSLVALVCMLAGCEEACHGEECHTEDASTARDAAALSPAEVYCNCMLTSCHDQYHSHFGPDTDEPAARAACLAEAAALPSAGMPATSGNSIECRMYFCEVGRTDETMCGGSIGEAPCM
jgi:hypothetical protein